MKPFDYFEPATLDEALDLLHHYGEKARVLAGGTDLVVQMKQGKVQPQIVISLRRIQDLNFIDINTGIRMGPLTSLRQIAAHPRFTGRLELLREAALAVGDKQIRNLATVGGNIANASPSADMPPALMALGARLTLRKKNEERIIGLNELCLGPFCTQVKTEELITEISIPSYAEGSGAYGWAPKRTAVDETLVGVAVWLVGDAAKKICQKVSIVLGSVAPAPLRAKEAEAFLLGREWNPENFRTAGEIASREASPRSRADYRRTMVGVLTREALVKASIRATF